MYQMTRPAPRPKTINGILDTLSTAYLTREQKKIAEAGTRDSAMQAAAALKLAEAKRAEAQGLIDLEKLRIAQAENKQQFIADLVKRGLPVIVLGGVALTVARKMGGKKKRR